MVQNIHGMNCPVTC